MSVQKRITDRGRVRWDVRSRVEGRNTSSKALRG